MEGPDNSCFNYRFDFRGLKFEITQNDNVHDILFANIRSLRKNHNDLLELIETLDHKFTFIVLNETWLELNEQELFKIDGYNIFSVPRNRHGGGVLIYCCNIISASQIEHLSFTCPLFESLFIDIKIRSHQFTLGSIYRPPTNVSNIGNFVCILKEKILSRLTSNNVILCGDLNIDLNSNSQHIENFCTEFNLFNIISNSTRVNTDDAGNIISSTLIDHIWTSFSNIKSSFVLEYHLTDHYPVGCFIDISKSSETPLNRTRIISNTNIDNYKHDFTTFFNNLIINPNTNDLFNEVFDTLKAIISNNFPIVEHKTSSKSLKRPWIDKTLTDLINKKHSIYSKCKRGLLPFNRFKNYRNLLNKTLDLAKKIYYTEKFHNINQDSRQTWKIINSVSNPTKSKVIKRNILINNVNIDDDLTLAFEFNQYFSNAVPRRAISNNPTYFIEMSPNNFFFHPISPQEVLNILCQMKNNSILSEMPIKLLKLLNEPLCFLFSKIFNLAIENEIFPDVLKCGVITPIPKKGNPKLISNHRGITIINPPSKIFDKLLYNRLYKYFEKVDLFTDRQFGFLKKRGIEQAALNLIHSINKANNLNETTVAVFIDLTKAFDCINHEILLGKLYRYGIRGSILNFFRSYLENRTHKTKINNSFSTPLLSNRGVAQGSNLGPLLFNIFINDVVGCVHDCEILIYADDIVLFKSSKNLNTIKNCLESDLHNLNQYFNDNDLFINLQKTKAMIFSRHKLNNLSILLDNNSIEFVNEFTYLGLTIDHKLTFKSHISKVTSKVNQGNGRIYYLSKFLPIYILKKIFFSIIYPHLNLHILIWGGANASHIQPLIVAVNKVIRNIEKSDDDTTTKYRKLHILPVNEIYKLKMAEFFFKTIKLNEHQLLTNIIEEISFEHNHNTRNVIQFRLPLINTNVNKSFFLSNAIKLWATIPDEIKNSPNIFSFKARFKKLFFDGVDNDFSHQ